MKVVLLLGPSTAGKTTLCKVLKQHYKWQVVSIDDVAEGLLFAQRPNIEKLLREQKLIEPFASIMSTEQLVHLSITGQLKLNKKDFKTHQFENPSFPNLEEILVRAGLETKSIPHITSLLRKASAMADSYLKKTLPPGDAVLTKTINQTFNYGPNDTIVIDIVPGQDMSPEKIKNILDQRAKQHHDETKASVETISVLAICSLQDLSARILQRNSEAVRADNPTNMRRGLFPIHQLLQIIQGCSEEKIMQQNKWQSFALAPITRAEVFEIADRHCTFMQRQQDKFSKRKDLLTMVPVSSNGSRIDHYKVGRYSVVQEYRNLVKKIGIKDGESRVPLAIKPTIDFDIAIRMHTKSPQDIAAELVERVAAFSRVTPSSPCCTSKRY